MNHYPDLLEACHRLVSRLIEHIESDMLVIDQIPNPTLSPLTHERGDSLVLILAQRPKHVKVALDPIRIGALRHHTNAPPCQPREDDLRRALAVIGGDGKDLVMYLTVSNLRVSCTSARRESTCLWIFERPGTFAIRDRWC